MIQVSHESPICMLDKSHLYNDYDYALVHLFDDHPQYFDHFKRSLQQDRKVYLDNSIFELGKSFNSQKYIEWIHKLEPTYYIVPDVLEDAAGTIKQLFEFNSILNGDVHPGPELEIDMQAQQPSGDCGDCGGGSDNPPDRPPDDIRLEFNPIKQIGVVQGKDWDELVECYQVMSQMTDMIAISFDYSYYLFTGRGDPKLPADQHVNWYDVIYGGKDLELQDADPMRCGVCKDKLHRYSTGRQRFIQQLIDEGIWNWNKPHHLLGCSLAKEFSYYTNSRTRVDNIVSIDTSNPVMAAIKRIKYDFENGLDGKPKGLLADLIDWKPSNDELNAMLPTLYFNTDMFKKIIGR